MKFQHVVWAFWLGLVGVMLFKWKFDPLMVDAVIVLPLLLLLLDMKEEILNLKEEAKHQRKFVMDRYTLLSEKLTDLSSQFEKKVVVDFAEFAKSNPPDKPVKKLKKKKKINSDQQTVDLAAIDVKAASVENSPKPSPDQSAVSDPQKK